MTLFKKNFCEYLHLFRTSSVFLGDSIAHQTNSRQFSALIVRPANESNWLTPIPLTIHGPFQLLFSFTIRGRCPNFRIVFVSR